MVVDALPDDGGKDADAEDDSMVADPPPADGGMSLNDGDAPAGKRLDVIDQWVDTGARRAVRSRDLPLFDPPEIEIVATRTGDAIDAQLRGAPAGATWRWEAEGLVEGTGSEIRWTPAVDADDSLQGRRCERPPPPPTPPPPPPPPTPNHAPTDPPTTPTPPPPPHHPHPPTHHPPPHPPPLFDRSAGAKAATPRHSPGPHPRHTPPPLRHPPKICPIPASTAGSRPARGSTCTS